jgi:hypothetical protein
MDTENISEEQIMDTENISEEQIMVIQSGGILSFKSCDLRPDCHSKCMFSLRTQCNHYICFDCIFEYKSAGLISEYYYCYIRLDGEKELILPCPICDDESCNVSNLLHEYYEFTRTIREDQHPYDAEYDSSDYEGENDYEGYDAYYEQMEHTKLWCIKNDKIKYEVVNVKPAKKY